MQCVGKHAIFVHYTSKIPDCEPPTGPCCFLCRHAINIKSHPSQLSGLTMVEWLERYG